MSLKYEPSSEPLHISPLNTPAGRVLWEGAAHANIACVARMAGDEARAQKHFEREAGAALRRGDYGCCFLLEITQCLTKQQHPGGNPGANLKSISDRCHPILVAFAWELTKETIHLPLGCLQGGPPGDHTVLDSTTFVVPERCVNRGGAAPGEVLFGQRTGERAHNLRHGQDVMGTP